MSDAEKIGSNAGKIGSVIDTVMIPRSVFPFTSGLIIAAYAWFWPESYGHWLGTIVHAFLTAAGLL